MIGDRQAPGDVHGPRRRWPTGFVGMLALVVAVEAGVVRAGREFESLIKADWRRQGVAASSEAVTQAEILCLGDSLVRTGIVPAALEARLDLPVYNLAALSGPVPASYYLLRRALDAGARPRAIVLDANEPQLWASLFRQDVAAWAGLISPPEAWRLARDIRDPVFFESYLVHRILPSARLRFDVRRIVAERLAGEHREHDMSWPDVLDRQAWRNRGACLFHWARPDHGTDPYPFGILPPNEWETWYRTVPLAQPTNLIYLDRLLALVEARGIPLFFIVPPIHPGVLEVRERVGLEAEYLALAGRLRDRYANVVVVDARHLGFDYSKFFDTCHLRADSATAFSNALAEVIGQHLEGPPSDSRWVSLSSYSEPTVRLAIESAEESKAVVQWRRLIR